MKFASIDKDVIRILIGSLLSFSLDFTATIYLINSLNKSEYGLLVLYISGFVLVSNILLGGLNRTTEVAGSKHLRKVFLDVFNYKLKYVSLPFVLYQLCSFIFTPFDNAVQYGFLVCVFALTSAWRNWFIGMNSLNTYYSLLIAQKVVYILTIIVVVKFKLDIIYILYGHVIVPIGVTAWLLANVDNEETYDLEIIKRGMKLSRSSIMFSLIDLENFLYSSIVGTAGLAEFSVLTYPSKKMKILLDMTRKYYVPRLLQAKSIVSFKPLVIFQVALFFVVLAFVFYFIHPMLFSADYNSLKEASTLLVMLGFLGLLNAYLSDGLQYFGSIRRYNIVVVFSLVTKLLFLPLGYFFVGPYGFVLVLFLTECIKWLMLNNFNDKEYSLCR